MHLNGISVQQKSHLNKGVFITVVIFEVYSKDVQANTYFNIASDP